MEGQIRKDFYSYLESQGLKVNDEIHAVIKKAFLDHARVQNERMVKDRNEALNALALIKFPPKDKTILDRLNEFKCPVCGISMKKLSAKYEEYVTVCGHMSDLMIALA